MCETVFTIIYDAHPSEGGSERGLSLSRLRSVMRRLGARRYPATDRYCLWDYEVGSFCEVELHPLESCRNLVRRLTLSPIGDLMSTLRVFEAVAKECRDGSLVLRKKGSAKEYTLNLFRPLAVANHKKYLEGLRKARAADRALALERKSAFQRFIREGLRGRGRARIERKTERLRWTVDGWKAALEYYPHVVRLYEFDDVKGWVELAEFSDLESAIFGVRKAIYGEVPPPESSKRAGSKQKIRRARGQGRQ